MILIDVPIALAHDEGGANGGGNQGTEFSIVNLCTCNCQCNCPERISYLPTKFTVMSYLP